MHILLIEDSAVEASYLLDALRDSPLTARLSVIGSGDCVLAYLRQQGEYRQVARPDVILWSPSGPALQVSSVLYELDTDSVLRMIPVFLLTNTRNWVTYQEQKTLNNVHIVPKPIGAPDYSALVNEVATWCPSTTMTNSTQTLFDRDPPRELLADRSVISFSRAMRGLRNRTKDRASIS